jgi:protein-disulfide isomerase
VGLVKELCGEDCDVTVYNLNEGGIDLARGYGVNSVPTVVVDGKILDCCRRGTPTADDLKAAGIGAL